MVWVQEKIPQVGGGAREGVGERGLEREGVRERGEAQLPSPETHRAAPEPPLYEVTDPSSSSHTHTHIHTLSLSHTHTHTQ
jgi:hypothetical protein